MLEKLPHAIGQALSGVRAGLERTIVHGPDLADVPDTLRVLSPAFADGGAIPERFTEDGDAVSPPLAWTGVPAAARAVTLVIEDADSPTPSPLVHAIVWNLPGRDGDIAEGALPSDDSPEGDASPGLEPDLGRNSFFGAEYLAPDPPPGHGPHRYVFQVFALAEPLPLDGHPGRSALMAAMRGRVLAKGALVGIYERE